MRGNRRTEHVDFARLYKRHQEGARLKDLADSMGISEKSIRYQFKKRGWKPINHRKKRGFQPITGVIRC